jgi:hypothetical protein
MIDVEVHKQVNPLWWNERLMASPDGNVFQTTYWAEYLRAQERVEPLYLIARERGEVVGLWMVTRGFQWQERLQSHPLRTPLRGALQVVAAEYRWKYGPVVLRTWSTERVLSSLYSGLDELAHSERVSRVMGQHPPVADADAHHRTCVSSSFLHQPSATILVDTTADVDALWQRLKPSARKAVRHCEAQGVRVEQIEHAAQLATYQETLRETRARLGLEMPPYYPNVPLWNCLRPGGHLEVFLAWQDERVLAGMGVLVFNGIVFELGSAMSNEAVARRIYAGDLIKWHIIRWAHESGHHTYDLAGVAVEPHTEKEKQILQFKSKWGGRLARCDEVSKTYPTHWRQMWRAVKRLRGDQQKEMSV